MSSERDEWISMRAYGLWEAEGRPHGRDAEHWAQAVRERDELERVALPDHLTAKKSPAKADAATRAALISSRRTKPAKDTSGTAARQ